MAARKQDWVGLTILAGILALVVIGAARLWSSGPAEAADWTSSEDTPAFPGDEELRRQGASLDARRWAAMARIEEKVAVAAAVIRGDIGLWAAADRFGQIIASEPKALNWLRARYPGATDAELLCRNVVAYVRGTLAMRPGLAPGLLGRLEAELTQMFLKDAGTPPPTDGAASVGLRATPSRVQVDVGGR